MNETERERELREEKNRKKSINKTQKLFTFL